MVMDGKVVGSTVLTTHHKPVKTRCEKQQDIKETSTKARMLFLKKSISGRVSLRKISLLIGFRGMGVLFQMLMQFAIARVAGAAGLGIVQLYQTWSCVLGEISAAGLPTQTMKSISLGRHRVQVIYRLKHSLKIIAQLWLVIVLLLLLIGSLSVGSSLISWIPFSVGCQIALMWSVLCFAVLRLSAEALKAMNCIGEAVFAENSLLPVCMLIYCLCVAYGIFTPSFTEPGGQTNSDTLIYVATLFLTAASIYSLVRSHAQASAIDPDGETDDDINHKDEAEFKKKEPIFTRETRYFWGSSVINIGFLSLPFLLMPYFGGLAAIGLFTLAFKLINPITTILGMLNALFCPSFAKAAEHEQDSKGLSKLLVQSQLLSLALYLPLLIPILVFSDVILAIFGEEFVDAKVYLFILAGAQLFNAVTGLSGNMLNMIGMGKREFQGAILFFVIGLIAGVFCGQQYGLIGIAIAYSVALAGKNIWSYSFAIIYILDHSEHRNIQACKLV